MFLSVLSYFSTFVIGSVQSSLRGFDEETGISDEFLGYLPHYGDLPRFCSATECLCFTGRSILLITGISCVATIYDFR